MVSENSVQTKCGRRFYPRKKASDMSGKPAQLWRCAKQKASRRAARGKYRQSAAKLKGNAAEFGMSDCGTAALTQAATGCVFVAVHGKMRRDTPPGLDRGAVGRIGRSKCRNTGDTQSTDSKPSSRRDRPERHCECVHRCPRPYSLRVRRAGPVVCCH
jgi:hypothetical protein